MVPHRLVTRPAFDIAGLSTYISGQDNALFGRFWAQCEAEGLLARLRALSGGRPGAQSGGVLLGVSRVERDPGRRDFCYMIAVEVEAALGGGPGDLERYRVPASEWAVFSARGSMPEALVAAEMYAFGEWLPASGYAHALAPEMEVYLPEPPGPAGVVAVEFWLPVARTGPT